jgi:DNA polymerase-3 subunit beta
MNLIIKRENLLDPLQHVIGAVERKQTKPILGHVLIRNSNGNMILKATDLEIELIADLKIDSSDEVETTLPARKLLDICKALPEGCTLNLSVEQNNVVLTSGRSRFQLASLPSSDFPGIDDIEFYAEFEVPQQTLKLLIDKTAFAMAQQDVRYYLNGMLLEINKEGIRLVATDGHRLALSENQMQISINTDKQLIIPRKGVMELSRLLSNTDTNAKVRLSQNHIRVETGHLVFTSKLIDGKFPDYNRVIPIDGNKILTVERDALKQCLQRISILSNEKYRGILLSLEKDTLTIQANNPDQEEAVEEMTVEYTEDKINIGFNVTYLLDVLSVLDSDKVNIRLKDANSSCIITAMNTDNFQYVVMPMRL